MPLRCRRSQRSAHRLGMRWLRFRWSRPISIRLWRRRASPAPASRRPETREAKPLPSWWPARPTASSARATRPCPRRASPSSSPLLAAISMWRPGPRRRLQRCTWRSNFLTKLSLLRARLSSFGRRLGMLQASPRKPHRHRQTESYHHHHRPRQPCRRNTPGLRRHHQIVGCRVSAWPPRSAFVGAICRTPWTSPIRPWSLLPLWGMAWARRIRRCCWRSFTRSCMSVRTNPPLPRPRAPRSPACARPLGQPRPWPRRAETGTCRPLPHIGTRRR
mmetsp:Transcript_140588/g.448214  ORF Transcript_140588/g.448214 Transcript_140588/m.448214 type:complete len:275 (-) Transcript_140588:661-1485(-)